MQKRIFLLFSSLWIMNFCFPQKNGIVTYTVTHDWIKKYASCEYISKTEKESMSYVWGGDNTQWELKTELKFNDNESRYEKKDDDDSWGRNEEYIIYRDREKRETFDVMTVLNRQYVILDSLDCQKWKIKSDMKEVAGHICMNASFYDTLKAKEIIAWFALDLPIPLGPDRYCGLPGMILEIDEVHGAVVYAATNVLLSDEKIEIAKPIVKKKRKIITIQEYNAIVNKYINECKKMQRPYFWGLSF